MDSNSKIWVTGHKGLVGSAIIRELKNQGYNNVVISDIDLTLQDETYNWISDNKPQYIFHAAAKVGGIGYNMNHPAKILHDNLMMQCNVIDSAYSTGHTKKLLFLGSGCIYPKHAPVPMKEESLMAGPLEPTNEAYSVAKIAGLMLCEKYTKQYGFPTLSVMPNNIYGINDNFRLHECHVIPAFIRKFLEAKEKGLTRVVCYGDGTPTREFLFADDLADGLIFLMNNYNDPRIINIGPNREIAVRDLAELIASTVGYHGEIIWDTAMPNGTPRKVLSTELMDALGWKAKTSLEEGIAKTIDWFIENRETYARV